MPKVNKFKPSDFQNPISQPSSRREDRDLTRLSYERKEGRYKRCDKDARPSHEDKLGALRRKHGFEPYPNETSDHQVQRLVHPARLDQITEKLQSLQIDSRNNSPASSRTDVSPPNQYPAEVVHYEQNIPYPVSDRNDQGLTPNLSDHSNKQDFGTYSSDVPNASPKPHTIPPTDTSDVVDHQVINPGGPMRRAQGKMRQEYRFRPYDKSLALPSVIRKTNREFNALTEYLGDLPFDQSIGNPYDFNFHDPALDEFLGL